MKIIASLFALLLFAFGLSAQTTPIGVWNTGAQDTKVEISEANGAYVGNIISSDNSEVKIGKQLLKDLKPAGEGWQGKLYAPKKEQWLDAKLQEKGNHLMITVGSGWMSKTLEWTKE